MGHVQSSIISYFCILLTAWNSRTIPGRSGGIPNTLAASVNQVTTTGDPTLVPSVLEAVNIMKILKVI